MAEERINLNTAPAQELDQLPGIGPVLAERIVTYRDTVGPFEEPAGVTAVSGIGERNYRVIADRVTVAPPGEGSTATPSAAREEAEDEEAAARPSAAEEESEGEPGPTSEEGASEETESVAAAELAAIPPGESLTEEGLPREEVEAAPRAAEGAAEEEAREEEAASATGEPSGAEIEEEPAEEEVPEEDLPPAALASPAEATPSPPWWRRLAWLWAAILGGLLGMVFALIVFAGINGSLDVGHTEAVLGLESDVSGLTTDVASLETDVEGLRRRLEALEGLTSRMDQVESAVDGLREETSELSERTGALEEDLGALSEELETISDDVATLQQQAERTESFFGGLRSLLEDVFGEVEGMSEPTPTPEEK